MTRLQVVFGAMTAMIFAGAAAAQQGQQQERQQSDDVKIERVESSTDKQAMKDQKAEDFGPMTADNVLNKLYQSNQKEIALGQLAAEKAENSRVKQFGQKLVQDHQKANEKIKELAKAQNIQLQETKMDDKQAKASQQQSTQQTDAQQSQRSDNQQQTAREGRDNQQAKADAKDMKAHGAEFQKLQSLSGSEFDEAFVSMMEHNHENTLDKLEEAQDQIDQPEVQQLIAELRPTLREHEHTAERLQDEFITARVEDNQGQQQQRQQGQQQQQQQRQQ